MGKISLAIMTAAALTHYMGYTPQDAAQYVKDHTPSVKTITSLLSNATNYGKSVLKITTENLQYAEEQIMKCFLYL